MANVETPASDIAKSRADCAKRFIDRARSEDATMAELQDLHERLQLLDAARAEALRGIRPSSRNLVAALTSIAILVSVASLIPVHSVSFTADVEASDLAMKLGEAGRLEQQVVSRKIEVEGLAHLESSSQEIGSVLNGGNDLSFAVKGADLRLKALGWDEGAVLRVSAGDDAIRLTVENSQGPAAASFELAGRTEWDSAEGKKGAVVDAGLGETLTIKGAGPVVEGGGLPPLVLVLGREGDMAYRWGGFRPRSLTFVQRQVPQRDTVFSSSLLSAAVTIPLVSRTTSLREGDRLQLSGVTLERCELVVGQTIRLRLSGSASELMTAVGGFERSLKPSLLEWLRHQHTLALVWSAAGFLWGVWAWTQQQTKRR